MAIVANAMTFHATLAAAKLGVRSFDELRRESPLKHLSRSIVIAEWRRILSEINYWPIFQIADDLMSPVSPREATSILEHLAKVADALHEIGTSTTHDLSGQMFGRLIADRKFLATFYTLPPSAALLAELAAARLDCGLVRPQSLHRICASPIWPAAPARSWLLLTAPSRRAIAGPAGTTPRSTPP